MYTVPRGESIAMPQDYATTCWLTCYQMMFKWRGINPNADGIKKALEGAGIAMFNVEGNGACETGLKAKQYPQAHGSIGLRALKGGPLDMTELEYLLEKSGPIWCTMRYGGYNHNVVIIGAGEDRVRWIDPYWEQGSPKAPTIKSNTLKAFNNELKRFDGWKGSNACWPW
ncbi:MAG: hypothetical protein JNL98_09295 [Bryobacterales bacterium]|nr:hypothetical protein [Bryobacterales bacterium]